MDNSENNKKWKKLKTKKALVSIIVILLVIVLGGLIFIKFLPISNASTANKKMTDLADVFYKYYYEENTVKDDDKATKEYFSNWKDIGITIRLKDLKIYLDNRKNEDYSAFKNCDETKSKLTVYPSEPFGPTNYSVKVEVQCK